MKSKTRKASNRDRWDSAVERVFLDAEVIRIHANVYKSQ